MKQFLPSHKLRLHFLWGHGSLILLALLFFAVPSSFGQTTVSGVITESGTGQTLEQAWVRVKDQNYGTYTDEDGAFLFEVPLQLPFTILAGFAGYETQELELTDNSTDLRFILLETGVDIDEVVITASPTMEKQKKSVLTVESMSLNAIKDAPTSSFYEGLGHLKGVDLLPASLGFKVINTRGFNSTSPVRSLQVIDGVDNQSPGLNFSLGNFLGASELDVEGVDLIVGASSAFFGPGAFNGVISMKTKSPFVHRGLSASVKVGERNMLEGAIRYAKVFRNKAGKDKFAFKINAFYLRADDWEANNLGESYRDTVGGTSHPYVGTNNPGGYDAVNRYGDENTRPGQNNATGRTDQVLRPGLGRYFRTGYEEKDVVDYDTRNFKSSLAMHYMLNDKVELIGSTAFSTGTTVYQGDNRYSLKDILFFQHRVEVRQKNKFFVRAYMTHEDAGNSYDAVFTAFRLQENRKDDRNWDREYRRAYDDLGMPDSVKMLEGFPPGPRPPDFIYDFDRADSVMAANNDALIGWHNQVRSIADNNFLKPGTPEFDAALQDITSRSIFEGDGTKFIDRSALYHLHGEYKFPTNFAEFTVGGNGRLYTPNTEGTIFLDTAEKITNYEFGAYVGIQKKFYQGASAREFLKINLTARADKNQNFGAVFSPFASIVWSITPEHILRTSFSVAVRNPTLADQYLYYNVGRAILLGNVNGVDSLVTVESFEDFSNSLNQSDLDYVDVPGVVPEKVRTIEVGYRGNWGRRLYVDAGYYYNSYKDFLGFVVGLDVFFFQNLPQFVQPYRVSANSKEVVTTQGFSIGLTYSILDMGANGNVSFSGNYSWNKLNTISDDPIIPAFNTPEHKYNLGITGRNLTAGKLKNFGFSVNYKWIEGYLFEGSPQFTGNIPSFYTVDAQINKRFPFKGGGDLTVKLGASNLTNNQIYQVYGGPLIGRLAYLSLVFDMGNW